MSALLTICLAYLVCRCAAQDQDSLPAKLPPVTIQGNGAGTCPSNTDLEQSRNDTKAAIQSILHDTVIPALNSHQPSCPCGGAGNWHRIAHLNMSDPDQNCPPNWRLITAPERACGRIGSFCDSAIFPSGGRSYSRVCGSVIAYQKGTPEGLQPTIEGRNPGLEGVYLHGVSLTHGAAGSRQHIWSFVAALSETSSRNSVCQCSNTNINWPFQLPSFIGTDYFCDTGNRGTGNQNSRVYSDDPLWDGEGCGPTSTCCQFNTPPWFCTTLPQPTTDDIELRICATVGASNEDIYIGIVDIYTM